ncbi:MAG TPA: phosphate ABC transporter substrate-binding protein [Polyangiaceae bacterium]|nr:phosphate ABC transporter substrate-binding protein [Polyangiaceae bacterium]
MTTTTQRRSVLLTLGAALVATLASGCKKDEAPTASTEGAKVEKAVAEAPAAAKKVSIQNIGSDTMVNLAQAWAEQYAKVVPGVSVEVSGGGSGVGIAALINGTADIANASRKMEPEETAKAKQSTGKEPTEFTVGFDGLAVYVNKANPLEQISIEELGEIYREGGKFDTWSDVGVKSIPGAKDSKIIRVSRQNNSGTYAYFRETVVGKKADYKSGSLDMNGSKDVVDLVARTPGAIGYSGLGYATPEVKILKVSAKKGDPGVMPSIPTVLDKSYPIARPLFMYTPGAPTAEVKKYLDWIMSDAGQKIVEQTGYVPLPKK